MQRRATSIFRLATAFACFAISSAAARAVADVYVVQVGNGVALTSASTAAFVQKFADSGGMPLATYSLPTMSDAANKPLTLSGSSISEGFLSLSTNGEFLTLGGYGIAPGQLQVAQTNSATVNRVVGRIEISTGTVDTSTALTDAYGGSAGSSANIRSVVSTDGTKFWSAGNAPTGSNAGVRYSELGGTTSTLISPAPTNVRVATIFGDQLYISSGVSNFFGVSAVGAGLPSTAGQSTMLLPGFPAMGAHSSYDYWFKDASTVYVADEGTAAAGGGIQKWELDAESAMWELTYTLLNNGSSNTPVRGLAGVNNGENVVLYATTTQAAANKLIMLTDSGADAAFTELATAPSNTAFRGVEYVVSPGLVGDYNDDGFVDAADYVVWRDNVGTMNMLANDPAGGQIGPTQYVNWQANFGLPNAGVGSGLAAGAVPEPGTIALLLIGLVAATARRRPKI